MGIFDRLSQMIRSNLNDLISSAENPEKMLNQIIIDMRSQLAKAKQQVAAAIADEKRLRDQVEGEYKQAQEWERRAMLAVQNSQDELAKQMGQLGVSGPCESKEECRSKKKQRNKNCARRMCEPCCRAAPWGVPRRPARRRRRRRRRRRAR